MQTLGKLLDQYNVPTPRYTSYPTVPFWQPHIAMQDWEQHFTEQFHAHNGQEGISLYLHLPFCESLCTYCGCNKKITTNHSVEEVYLQAILREWSLYLSRMEERPVLREVHLGGGTPTFFSPQNLERLLLGIFKHAVIHPQHSFSIEGHPNNTTAEHLQVLYDLGFRRISYGVQDNDPEVQRIIHRIQPIENVEKAIRLARQIGFTSVNIDLIYGLPRQTEASILQTLRQSIALQPDRVAFYSYAHVPWTSRGQRLFDEHDLPDAHLKMRLYRLGKALFTNHGYHDIGMDHFALPHDELFEAHQKGMLHRNFMGYTTQHSGLLLGLGVSAISDIGTGYAQNHKNLQDYYRSIEKGELPVTKGYFLTEEDLHFKQYILDISCRGFTHFREADLPLLETYSFPELSRLAANGLIAWGEDLIQLTATGRHFIRNVCKAFDLHLLQQQAEKKTPLFSQAI